MGEDIFSPEYLPNGTGISVPKSVSVLSQKVIVVEGLATLYEGIKDLIDITVYIETDLDTRHDRFISRACQERNQDLENALKHWDYIIEEGKKYILPSRENVDLIIDGNVDLRYFSGILKYIHTVTNNFETDEKI